MRTSGLLALTAFAAAAMALSHSQADKIANHSPMARRQVGSTSGSNPTSAYRDADSNIDPYSVPEGSYTSLNDNGETKTEDCEDGQGSGDKTGFSDENYGKSGYEQTQDYGQNENNQNQDGQDNKAKHGQNSSTDGSSTEDCDENQDQSFDQGINGDSNGLGTTDYFNKGQNKDNQDASKSFGGSGGPQFNGQNPEGSPELGQSSQDLNNQGSDQDSHKHSSSDDSEKWGGDKCPKFPTKPEGRPDNKPPCIMKGCGKDDACSALKRANFPHLNLEDLGCDSFTDREMNVVWAGKDGKCPDNHAHTCHIYRAARITGLEQFGCPTDESQSSNGQSKSDQNSKDTQYQNGQDQNGQDQNGQDQDGQDQNDQDQNDQLPVDIGGQSEESNDKKDKDKKDKKDDDHHDDKDKDDEKKQDRLLLLNTANPEALSGPQTEQPNPESPYAENAVGGFTANDKYSLDDVEKSGRDKTSLNDIDNEGQSKKSKFSDDAFGPNTHNNYDDTAVGGAVPGEQVFYPNQNGGTKGDQTLDTIGKGGSQQGINLPQKKRAIPFGRK